MRFLLVLLLFFCTTVQAQYAVTSNKKISVENTAEAPALITITDLLYDNLQLENLGLSREIFYYAYKGYQYLLQHHKIKNYQYLTIVDFSQSCNNKRLYVIDINNNTVLYNTYVSHGKNSGVEYANSFSNHKDSYKSSIGFMLTAEVYIGQYGTALKLDGVEKGINDKVRERDIVLHASNLVNEKRIKANGRIARSLGCPAVPRKEHALIIKAIKEGSCFFVYHPNKTYALQSKIMNSVVDELINDNASTAIAQHYITNK
jgi:hypothetical protein